MFVLTSNALTIYDDQYRPNPFQLADIAEDKLTEALGLLKQGNYAGALDLLTPKKAIMTFFSSNPDITIEDGHVVYQGRRLDNYAAKRAVELAGYGAPYQPLLNFIARVQQNPSYRAVQELYAFLEAGQCPLTADGCFVAYKKVKRTGTPESDDLVDIHTGTLRNNPGDVVEMPRNEVDEDPSRTCSNGLHVCSYHYLPHFGTGAGSAVIAVKVDPADVVAVPRDYHNTKMRVCRYEVLKVVEDWRDKDVLAAEPMYEGFDEDDVDEEFEAVDDDDLDDADLEEPAFFNEERFEN